MPTPVYRFYRGGALLGCLRGTAQDNSYFPEDWAGSITEASNPGRGVANEGLTALTDGTLLRDLIAADPLLWLGQRHVERFGASTALLVKLLDAGERLPVHFHPSRSFAQAHLSCPFGKTEAWYVIATREDKAKVWVGMRESVDTKTYHRWIESQATDELLGSLNEVDVRAGDLVYVPAGVPHAIGEGLLVAELQEPTDFSLICEWSGFPIRPPDAHLGLGWETALRAIDLSAHIPFKGLPESAAAFFSADHELVADGRFAVIIVLAGPGTIGREEVRPGDVFAVPASSGLLEVTGSPRVLRCVAPVA